MSATLHAMRVVKAILLAILAWFLGSAVAGILLGALAPSAELTVAPLVGLAAGLVVLAKGLAREPEGRHAAPTIPVDPSWGKDWNR